MDEESGVRVTRSRRRLSEQDLKPLADTPGTPTSRKVTQQTSVEKDIKLIEENSSATPTKKRPTRRLSVKPDLENVAENDVLVTPSKKTPEAAVIMGKKLILPTDVIPENEVKDTPSKHTRSRKSILDSSQCDSSHNPGTPSSRSTKTIVSAISSIANSPSTRRMSRRFSTTGNEADSNNSTTLIKRTRTVSDLTSPTSHNEKLKRSPSKSETNDGKSNPNYSDTPAVKVIANQENHEQNGNSQEVSPRRSTRLSKNSPPGTCKTCDSPKKLNISLDQLHITISPNKAKKGALVSTIHEAETAASRPQSKRMSTSLQFESSAELSTLSSKLPPVKMKVLSVDMSNCKNNTINYDKGKPMAFNESLDQVNVQTPSNKNDSEDTIKFAINKSPCKSDPATKEIHSMTHTGDTDYRNESKSIYNHNKSKEIDNHNKSIETDINKKSKEISINIRNEDRDTSFKVSYTCASTSIDIQERSTSFSKNSSLNSEEVVSHQSVPLSAVSAQGLNETKKSSLSVSNFITENENQVHSDKLNSELPTKKEIYQTLDTKPASECVAVVSGSEANNALFKPGNSPNDERVQVVDDDPILSVSDCAEKEMKNNSGLLVAQNKYKMDESAVCAHIPGVICSPILTSSTAHKRQHSQHEIIDIENESSLNGEANIENFDTFSKVNTFEISAKRSRPSIQDNCISGDGISSFSDHMSNLNVNYTNTKNNNVSNSLTTNSSNRKKNSSRVFSASDLECGLKNSLNDGPELGEENVNNIIMLDDVDTELVVSDSGSSNLTKNTRKTKPNDNKSVDGELKNTFSPSKPLTAKENFINKKLNKSFDFAAQKKNVIDRNLKKHISFEDASIKTPSKQIILRERSLYTSTPKTEKINVLPLTEENKDTMEITETKLKNVTPSRSSSASSESDESSSKNGFVDESCEEADNDYASGDSLDGSERELIENNEIRELGETLDSESSISSNDSYDKNSFIVSSDDENTELLSGTGDDLNSEDEELNFSQKPKNKYNVEANKMHRKMSSEIYASHHCESNNDSNKNTSQSNSSHNGLESNSSNADVISIKTESNAESDIKYDLLEIESVDAFNISSDLNNVTVIKNSLSNSKKLSPKLDKSIKNGLEKHLSPRNSLESRKSAVPELESSNEGERLDLPDIKRKRSVDEFENPSSLSEGENIAAIMRDFNSNLDNLHKQYKQDLSQNDSSKSKGKRKKNKNKSNSSVDIKETSTLGSANESDLGIQVLFESKNKSYGSDEPMEDLSIDITNKGLPKKLKKRRIDAEEYIIPLKAATAKMGFSDASFGDGETVDITAGNSKTVEEKKIVSPFQKAQKPQSPGIGRLPESLLDELCETPNKVTKKNKKLRPTMATTKFKVEKAGSKKKPLELDMSIVDCDPPTYVGSTGTFRVVKKSKVRVPFAEYVPSKSGSTDDFKVVACSSTTEFRIVPVKKRSERVVQTGRSLPLQVVNFKNDRLFGPNIKRQSFGKLKQEKAKLRASGRQRAEH